MKEALFVVVLALVGGGLKIYFAGRPIPGLPVAADTSRLPVSTFPHDYADGKAHTWTLRFIYRDQICIETRTDGWVGQMCGEDAAQIVQAIAGSVKR